MPKNESSELSSDLVTALQQAKPVKKISLVRSLMPAIREATQRGLSKKEIWTTLKSAGLELPYNNFLTYLDRIAANNKELKSIGPGTQEPTKLDHGIQNKLDHGIQKEHSDVAGEKIEPIENQGLSASHAALAEVRKETSKKDYSKIIRDRDRSKSKP